MSTRRLAFIVGMGILAGSLLTLSSRWQKRFVLDKKPSTMHSSSVLSVGVSVLLALVVACATGLF
jgi:hypothetical protein